MTTNYHTAFPTNNAANAADVESRFSSLDTQITANTAAIVSGAGVTDHSALTGLTDPSTDDDHTQYALLYGRAGGQTLYGGTAANDDLILNATRHGTVATSEVRLANTGGSVVIGGGGAPGAKLEVGGSTGASPDVGLRMYGTYSAYSSQVIQTATTHPLGAGTGTANFDANNVVTGAEAADHICGFQARPTYNGTGTLGYIYDVYTRPSITAAGVVDKRFGMNVQDVNLTAGVLNTQYGIFIATLDAATTNWGLYVNENDSYLGGTVKVLTALTVNQATGLATVHVTGGLGGSDDRGIRLDGTFSTATSHGIQVESSHPLGAGNAVAFFDAKGKVTGAAAVDHIVGFQARPDYYGTATITNVYDFYASSQLTGSGTTTNRYGLFVAAANLAAGALTNQYGVYIATMAAGTNKWGLYVAGNDSFLGGALTLAEMSAPGAPTANSLVIYAVDNGAGKTQLMVRFPSGAAQQIAIEA